MAPARWSDDPPPVGAPPAPPARVRTAHADATEAQGRLRRPVGGDAARLPGVRMMASGLPQGQWNGADVEDPARADMDAVARWYRERGVPAWGVTVAPAPGFAWGRTLLVQPLMALGPGALVEPPAVPGLALRRAGVDDAGSVVPIDAACFDEDAAVSGPWVLPHLSSPRVVVALAELDGRPVATGYALRTDGDAGPAANIGGVAVLAAARRRGVGAVVSHWLARAALEAGATLAHLHADTEEAARVYRRLGFADAGVLEVRLPA